MIPEGILAKQEKQKFVESQKDQIQRTIQKKIEEMAVHELTMKNLFTIMENDAQKEAEATKRRNEEKALMLKTRKVKKETEKVTIRLQDAILKKFTKKK